MQHPENDILAFGAHPDDVELGCSGTLMTEISKGAKVVVCDLTRGELGSRGNAETRQKEAAAAAEIMGVKIRHNCKLKDGFLASDDDSVETVIEEIRFFRPRIIICNAPADRHPDHTHAAELVRKAAFLSGLSKIPTEWGGTAQRPWRPEQLYHYIQFNYIEPGIIVDISANFDRKMRAIRAYRSQFYDPHSKEAPTLIATRQFLDFVHARCVEFGMRIGVQFGEGFVTGRTPGTGQLSHLL